MFFPDEVRASRRRIQEQAAIRICRGCPVLAECADYALRAPETYGIWGAMTSRERAVQGRRRALGTKLPPSPGGRAALRMSGETTPVGTETHSQQPLGLTSTQEDEPES